MSGCMCSLVGLTMQGGLGKGVGQTVFQKIQYWGQMPFKYKIAPGFS